MLMSVSMSIALTTLTTLTTFRRLRTDEREKNLRTGEAKNGISNIKCPINVKARRKAQIPVIYFDKRLSPLNVGVAFFYRELRSKHSLSLSLSLSYSLSLPFSEAQTSSFSFYVYVSLSITRIVYLYLIPCLYHSLTHTFST